jgi:hypothetical protein
MRKWVKRVGILSGGLLGLGGLLAPVERAQAQYGPLPQGHGMFAADPQPPMPAEFPNPAKGGGEPVSPFSIRDEGMPNAFTCMDAPPSTTPPYHMLLRAEYLSWWMPRINVPGPLLTTSTDTVVGPTTGIPGAPGTLVLLNQESYNMGATDGYRVTMGLAPGFMPPFEVSGMWFNRNSTIYNIASNGNLILVRPFQTVNAVNIGGLPTPTGQLVAAPGFGAGYFNASSTFNLWASDLDFFVNFADNGTIQLDFMFGYKHADYNDSFVMQNSTPPGTLFDGTVLPPGFQTQVVDSFAAHNQFNGGTLGLRSRLGWGRLMFWSDAKLSLGSTNEWISTNGSTTLGARVLPGGLLALPSNMGVTTRHEFSVIPELNLMVSCQITPNIRVFGGYNIFYWSSIVRSSDQISTIIDTTQLPTGPNAGAGAFIPGHVGSAPLPGPHSTTFFAHGINLGFEVGF